MHTHFVCILFFLSTCGAAIFGVPVFHFRVECPDTVPLESQAIYGHSVEVIEDYGNGWGLIESEDGYQGCGRLDGLFFEKLNWDPIVRVASVAGLVYPNEDTTGPALLRLPFDARVKLLDDYEGNTKRWLQVELVDGTLAWMQRGDLELVRNRSLEEMIALSFKFLELPSYIWGGNSSEGYDCSGFVQTLFKQMGVILPKNSRDQAASNLLIPLDRPEKPGDIAFFGDSQINHVGLYLGEGKFIHSGVKDNKPKISVSEVDHCGYHYITARRLKK